MNSTATDTSTNVSPGPAPTGGVVPYLQVDGANAAAEFYKRAFDAVELGRQPVDEKGRTMHIHLRINGGSVMLSDPYPEHGYPLQKPQAFDLMMPVTTNIDALFKRALDAGATEVMPVQDMLWGDRYGQLRDPFGVTWSMNQPNKR